MADLQLELRMIGEARRKAGAAGGGKVMYRASVERRAGEPGNLKGQCMEPSLIQLQEGHKANEEYSAAVPSHKLLVITEMVSLPFHLAQCPLGPPGGLSNRTMAPAKLILPLAT